LIEKTIGDMKQSYQLKIIKGWFVEDHWLLLQEVQAKEQNRIEAEAFVPADSLWFSGHFPGEPILPGMALIHLVWQAIVRDAGKRSEEIKLDTLRRVRFTQPVRPGEKLSVLITGDSSGDKTLYSFKIVSRENVICNGLIEAVKIKR
jgi:3-hydroxyacyl-[acyl-carrier-protein] dehydratase